eukprot:13544602-Alexandrium_andersonii.AAC.1
MCIRDRLETAANCLLRRCTFAVIRSALADASAVASEPLLLGLCCSGGSVDRPTFRGALQRGGQSMM